MTINTVAKRKSAVESCNTLLRSGVGPFFGVCPVIFSSVNKQLRQTEVADALIPIRNCVGVNIDRYELYTFAVDDFKQFARDVLAECYRMKNVCNNMRTACTC